MTDEELIEATAQYILGGDDPEFQEGEYSYKDFTEPQKDYWRGQAKRLIEYLRQHDTNRAATAEEIGRAILNTRI